MAMSVIRKKLQDKLRRKYKWQTNTNYNRGVMLIKGSIPTCNDSITMDLAIGADALENRGMFRYGKCNNEINIYLSKYKQDDITKNHTILSELSTSISFEELELVYSTLKAYREELKTE